MRKKIILFDNFDSFTWNLLHLIQMYLNIKELNHEVLLVKNSDKSIFKHTPDAFIISPGPMGPNETGFLKDFFNTTIEKNNIPVLGVCLGMQFLACYDGASIIESKHPIHGRTSEIIHNGKGLFNTLNSPFIAARYNSLEVEFTGSTNYNVDAVCKKTKMVMAISHKFKNFYGIQFHPESFLTPSGINIIDNFFTLCNV